MAVRQVAAAALCSFTPLEEIPSALDALVGMLLLKSSLDTANQVSLTPVYASKISTWGTLTFKILLGCTQTCQFLTYQHNYEPNGFNICTKFMHAIPAKLMYPQAICV